MALEVEIWNKYIIGGLFKDNEFLNRSFIADEHVLVGKVVHIPQAGSASSTTKNRTSLPATISKRSDTEVTYALDEFTTDPVLVTNIETIQYSYNKRESVFGENLSALKQVVADWMLRNWAPELAAQIIRTTGEATLATSTGATGNRKRFTKDSLLRAKTILNKQNISKEGRTALIPSDLMESLQSDKDLLLRDYAGEVDVKNGIVTRLFGFDLMERSSVLTYSNAGTPAVKDPSAATAATDNQSVLCWQTNAVERALGTVKMFERLNDPTYFGDIYSMLVMMGGRQRRSDGKGIVAIVEDAAA